MRPPGWKVTRRDPEPRLLLFRPMLLEGTLFPEMHPGSDSVQYSYPIPLALTKSWCSELRNQSSVLMWKINSWVPRIAPEPYNASSAPSLLFMPWEDGQRWNLQSLTSWSLFPSPRASGDPVAFLVCHAEIGWLLFVVPLGLAGFRVCPLPRLRPRSSGVPGRGNYRDVLGREWWRSARTADCWVTS